MSGTSIGAGMLALPIATGVGGFVPALLIYTVSWLVMTMTGILLAEASTALAGESNIISLANTYLGKKGKAFTWVVYLFLFYLLMVSYISAGGELWQGLFSFLSPQSAISLFTVFFALFVYWGTKAVDRINFLLVIGLIISYLFFVFLGFQHIDPSLLKVVRWSQSIFSFPIVLISFGYQGIVPTLTHYLNNDLQKVKKSIILGTTLTFVIYILWELLILGIVPLEGPGGLLHADALGQTAVEPLKNYTRAPLVYTVGRYFSFCAVTTSFLGVSLALYDFLSDGLKIVKKGTRKLFLAFLTFAPPLMISMLYPHLFIIALRYAGSIGGTLLLIFLPVAISYFGRYKSEQWKIRPALFGGKISLYFLLIFVVFIVVVELFSLFYL